MVLLDSTSELQWIDFNDHGGLIGIYPGPNGIMGFILWEVRCHVTNWQIAMLFMGKLTINRLSQFQVRKLRVIIRGSLNHIHRLSICKYIYIYHVFIKMYLKICELESRRKCGSPRRRSCPVKKKKNVVDSFNASDVTRPLFPSLRRYCSARFLHPTKNTEMSWRSNVTRSVLGGSSHES